MLSRLPNRLAHSLRAGHQARYATVTVAPSDAGLLISAALLHDIGYAPALRRTGFHPVDGALFLREVGAPDRLSALVAHHSEARLQAAAHGALEALAEFRHESGAVTDALIWADMTSGPTGTIIGVSERLADIAARHANEPPELLAARLARVPRLLAATARVDQRRGRALKTG
jgi:putative nucleotidyltransferase with HDIG domain